MTVRKYAFVRRDLIGSRDEPRRTKTKHHLRLPIYLSKRSRLCLLFLSLQHR